MPVFSGNAALGVQIVGNYDAVDGTWVALELPSFQTDERTTRVGLLIVGVVNPIGNVSVVEVFKVFSHGNFVLPRYPLLPARYNLSVRWFVPGIPWVLRTP